MSGMFTHAHWKHLEEGLRRTDLLSGIIHPRDGVMKITFTTPSGETIEVPADSKLEIEFGQKEDLYAIGIEHRPGEFGMTHGPVPKIEDMLAISPPDPKAKIICFLKHNIGEKKTHFVNREGEWEEILYDPDEMAWTDEL